MGYGSIVSIFDRLSVKTVLTNHTGSYIGFIGTLAFIAVCLIVLIPPVYLYFSGAYFESQFVSDQHPKNVYNTGDDVILAMVFRNKKTGELANHTDLLENMNSNGYYYGRDSIYKTDLEPCRPEVFRNSINAMEVSDCVMLPANLEYDITPVSGFIPNLELAFTYKCDDVFKCSSTSPYYNQTIQYLVKLAKQYYFEFIFNSKVLDDKGNYLNQFHKIYSSEFTSPDGTSAYTYVEMSQKKYFVDDSILPWWNNRTYSNVFWSGKAGGIDNSQGQLQAFGYYNQYFIFTQYIYSYRYYQKLDFLLSMIGGAVFLIFLFFWVPCSYVNRTLQKMKNAEELLMLKDSIITTEQNLHKVKIPWYYIFTRYLPCNTTNQIIQAAEHEIDIVKLIKKNKVTHRNLRTKGIDVTFKSKDVDLNVNEPQEFIPDRPVLENYEITLPAYQALSQSPSTQKIYENNPVVLALTQNNNEKIDAVMADEIYEKVRPSKFASVKERIRHGFTEGLKFFDIFGAKPMLNAEPENSSCWGFLLTLVIITLAILTFALTIKNIDSVRVISNYIYEKPEDHSYEMTTGRNFRFSFCVPGAAISAIAGANKTAQITFFKKSKKQGYQELAMQKMIEGDFKEYYELDAENPYTGVRSQNCFRPVAGQSIPMAGSYESLNEAYFGVRLDPYCAGLPAECNARKNQTIADFLKFINYNTYGVYLSENRYSPDQNRIVSGIAVNQVSESDFVMNASLLRTETFYVSAIEFLDDTSKSFLRTPPQRLVKTMRFTNFGDRNQQRKGDPAADPAYVLQFRPNGQVEQIILRTYKLDFILGLIGGSFVFWYFIVHFFAKFYNSYKVRAKLAEVLHQQDGYDESMLVHFLYLINFPTSLCCLPSLRQDIERVEMVDKKMQRDLDYLNLVKNVDSCYRLSGALFENIAEKDLSLIYFREKIDESEQVKPKRINEIKNDDFEDDEFLEFDDDFQNQELLSVNNGTNNILPEVSMPDIDLQKIINLNRSKEQVPLYDHTMPYKKQNQISRILKNLDAFKNPPELTLDGQRDVKSICGAIMFFILAILIIIVCYYFLKIYTSGADYTVSHRRLIDGNLEVIDPSSTLGELSQGIKLNTGSNFKFAVAFNRKDRYFPHNVSQFIGPIGIRMLQYTIDKSSGVITQSYEQTELEPCRDDYFEGFLSPYNDRQAFTNISLGYCVPDGKAFSLSGSPEQMQTRYFKLNIYNKFGNATGRAFLNSFFKIYLVTYYMSVPRMDMFAKDFQYEMIKFNYLTDAYSIPLEENITLTKVILTDKYYSRSRETYNDRSTKSNERIDVDGLASENARNLSFYYDGVLDHYTLDYPGGAQLFGLVGGVIAFFVFIIYNLVSSFNEYRMKYLIGQRLYTFDKKLSGLSKEKGRKPNLKKIQQATKKINNFNELQILLAWILNPIGYIRDNYNFNKTLRRITLIIDKVESDINLYNFYQDLLTHKSALDKKLKLAPNQDRQFDDIRLSSIFIKHIYNPDPIENHIPIISKQSKKHKLSSYEEVKIKNAIEAKVDPKNVLGEKVLNRAFGIDEGSSIFRPQMEEEQVPSELDRTENKKKKEKKKATGVHSANQNSTNQLREQQSREGTRHVEAFEIEESSRAEQ